MNKQPSTALIVALAVVACFAIGATALILITLQESELPEGWLGLFLGFLATTIATVVAVGKVDKIGRQVDELSNGRMDSKMRAAVADVVKNEHLDPDALPQLERDRQIRDGH